MSIRHAILGFLSWKPFTGYELKKIFANALSFHWSGNSNQIYGSLIQLHKDEAVDIEVQQQEKYPARKVYAIRESGLDELRSWLRKAPELPEIRNHFHIQLAWADLLSEADLDALLEGYELLLSNHILMCRETGLRGGLSPARSPREALIWRRIEEGRLACYEAELAWAKALRTELAKGES
jgi:PadR family transcriptional regulator, regulatory protein AphA